MGKKLVLAVALCAAALCCFLPRRAEAAGELRLPVVMYHHVSENPARWNDYVISPAELESDLETLARLGYRSIRVRDLLDWTEGRFTMPEKPCLIPFDDGNESTMAYAEPLLEKHGFTAACAVIGAVCEKFSALDEHDPELSNLSWEDAAAMSARGTVEILCHTWDMHALHPRRGCAPLRGEGKEAYRRALESDLQTFLDAAAAHGVTLTPAIAYPYGAYTASTAELVRDMGFRAAFTCEEQVNVLSGDARELFSLGRYNRPHGVSGAAFFARWEQ